jgi:hypothetical protein
MMTMDYDPYDNDYADAELRELAAMARRFTEANIARFERDIAEKGTE